MPSNTFSKGILWARLETVSVQFWPQNFKLDTLDLGCILCIFFQFRICEL